MLFFRPFITVFSDSVMVTHRTAQFQSFFYNNPLYRMMVNTKLVFRSTVDIVVVHKVHVSSINITVRRMSSQHCQIVCHFIFVADSVYYIVVNLCNVLPIR